MEIVDPKQDTCLFCNEEQKYWNCKGGDKADTFNFFRWFIFMQFSQNLVQQQVGALPGVEAPSSWKSWICLGSLSATLENACRFW